jgi:hypothetical protein
MQYAPQAVRVWYFIPSSVGEMGFVQLPADKPRARAAVERKRRNAGLEHVNSQETIKALDEISGGCTT